MKKLAFARELVMFFFVLLAALPLLAFAPVLQANAESRTAQVRYEVSATIVFIDDEIETVQKVPVGTTLKEPQPKGSKDAFIGWINRETGTPWDFASPVEGNLTLVACYRVAGLAGMGPDSESAASPAASAPLADWAKVSNPHSSQKTGDAALLFSAIIALLAGALGVFAAVRKRL